MGPFFVARPTTFKTRWSFDPIHGRQVKFIQNANNKISGATRNAALLTSKISADIPCVISGDLASINQSKSVTPRRRWSNPTDASAMMVAQRRLSSATRSNDEIDWSVHALMLSFHDLRGLPLRRLPHFAKRRQHRHEVITIMPCSMHVKFGFISGHRFGDLKKAVKLFM